MIKNTLKRATFTIFTISFYTHTFYRSLHSDLCNSFQETLRPIIWKTACGSQSQRELLGEGRNIFGWIMQEHNYMSALEDVQQKKGQQKSTRLFLINHSSSHVTAYILISVHQDNHLWFLAPKSVCLCITSWIAALSTKRSLRGLVREEGPEDRGFLMKYAGKLNPSFSS